MQPLLLKEDGEDMTRDKIKAILEQCSNQIADIGSNVGATPAINVSTYELIGICQIALDVLQQIDRLKEELCDIKDERAIDWDFEAEKLRGKIIQAVVDTAIKEYMKEVGAAMAKLTKKGTESEMASTKDV